MHGVERWSNVLMTRTEMFITVAWLTEKKHIYINKIDQKTRHSSTAFIAGAVQMACVTYAMDNPLPLVTLYHTVSDLFTFWSMM